MGIMAVPINFKGKSNGAIWLGQKVIAVNPGIVLALRLIAIGRHLAQENFAVLFFGQLRISRSAVRNGFFSPVELVSRGIIHSILISRRPFFFRPFLTRCGLPLTVAAGSRRPGQFRFP